MKQTTNSKAKNMATTIAVPHLAKASGISPNSLRTFSERSSMSPSCFCPIMLF